MKPLIWAFVILIVVLLGVGWMEGRFGNSIVLKNKEILDKTLYLTSDTVFGVGKESDISLMAKNMLGVVKSYWIYITFDPSLVKVTGLLVDRDVFDVIEENTVNSNLGLIILKAKSSKKISETISVDQRLATIKVEGLKKGWVVFNNSRKSEVGNFVDGNLIEDNFEFRVFRVEIK